MPTKLEMTLNDIPKEVEIVVSLKIKETSIQVFKKGVYEYLAYKTSDKPYDLALINRAIEEAKNKLWLMREIKDTAMKGK